MAASYASLASDFAEPAQQLGPYGMPCVVAGQRQCVDEGERDLRPVELRDGDGAVERNDR